MPEISARGTKMPESSIRKLVPYAEEALKKGRTVYHLNIGQPDIPTSPQALEALKNIDLKIIEYGHSAGNITFRKKFAEYYKRIGIDLKYEDILITTGGSEALLTVLMTCTNPDDEVIVPEPFYANYFGFSITLGVKVVPVKSYIESGFALPPIDEIENIITPKTKAILLCNPNNPTGYLYTQEELLQLKDIVLKHNLFLISDEVYREFCYDGRKHVSAMALEGLDKHAVLVDSISKRYSATGLRIGVLASKNSDVIKTALKFGQARLCPPAIGQIAGEAALDTSEEYIKEVITEYQKRRDFLVTELNKIEGVFCPNPKGAFYVMVRLPVDDADKFCQWMLGEFEYNNQTVMLAPGAGFYSNPEQSTNEARIAYVLNIENLKKAIEVLSKALEAYPGRKLFKNC